ncbi:MAG TPA: sensor histidine kinase [Rhizomicrobium sp.]|jgi:signal transduction histidine kinase|nr:sensor histidine kinase [Rhizomicrobium sp.]
MDARLKTAGAAQRIAQRFDSLSARLIAAAAVWTLLGLLVGGYVLSGVFRSAVEGDFDARLRSYLDVMIAAAEPTAEGAVSLQDRFADPRFERVYSGWYWQITPVGPKGPLTNNAQISRSLWDRTIKVTDSWSGHGTTWGHGEGPEGQRLRLVAQRIEFPVQPGSPKDGMRAYSFLVAADVTEVENEVAKFDTTLFRSFAILGLGLIAAIFIQVRIGLQPLNRVSVALARIRDGKARRLVGRFPAEIAPLATELNSLIEHSAEVVGRARTHVSNLAHFLKTPLSVLASEASAHPGPLADAVLRQVATMRRQVDHYLARARAAGALDVLGNRTPVRPAIEDLARVLSRIHAVRGLAIDVDVPRELAFRGERQDLEEMAGNLIDNACKWARSRVAVSARKTAGAAFELRVGDDGDGLDPEERARVGERGERLDETMPGSGLGLAIVRDIAKLYGGLLTLDESPLGGLEARLSLPAIA